METKLYLDINAQPDGTTCGPTCLHAIYRYFDDAIPLNRVISEVKQLKGALTGWFAQSCWAFSPTTETSSSLNLANAHDWFPA